MKLLSAYIRTLYIFTKTLNYPSLDVGVISSKKQHYKEGVSQSEIHPLLRGEYRGVLSPESPFDCILLASIPANTPLRSPLKRGCNLLRDYLYRTLTILLQVLSKSIIPASRKKIVIQIEKGRTTLPYILLGILSLTLLTACHNHDHSEGGHSHDTDTAHAHAEDSHAGHAHNPDGSHPDSHAAHAPHSDEDEITLTELQMEKIGLQFGTFEGKNLEATLKVNGKLELPPQSKASVSSMTSGKITDIAVEPGQYVKRGAVLATIHNPDLIGWQQEYLEVQGELLFLDKEYLRQKKLVEKEIAPEKNYEKVVSQRAIAHAKIAGLKSRMKSLGIPVPTSADDELATGLVITTPLSGYVREIKANTGLFVEPQQELFEIVDNRRLHIDFLVFEKDLPYIKKRQIVKFGLQSQPKKVMKSKIFSIEKAINEADRSISVHAEIIDGTSELIPGMYVEGRIVLDDKKVAALPEEAVTVDKGLYYIFVKAEAHDGEVHFKKVPILKGTTDLGYVEVTPIDELDTKAEIVTEGAYFLMAESKKGEQAVGHSH